MGEPGALTRAAIEAVWRVEAARLIGGLVRFVRDVDRAEDLAQEALLAALERWPRAGIPLLTLTSAPIGLASCAFACCGRSS
jgi:predicted RNA polymerase sigma factor